MIRLKNQLREPRTYEIPLAAGAGHVRQDVTTVRRSFARAGENLTLQSAARTQSRVLPPSVTLMAAGTKGDTSGPLPDNVQHVQPFKGLIEARALKVVVEPEPKPAAEASAPPKAETKPTKKAEAKAERGDK